MIWSSTSAQPSIFPTQHYRISSPSTPVYYARSSAARPPQNPSSRPPSPKQRNYKYTSTVCIVYCMCYVRHINKNQARVSKVMDACRLLWSGWGRLCGICGRAWLRRREIRIGVRLCLCHRIGLPITSVSSRNPPSRPSPTTYWSTYS